MTFFLMCLQAPPAQDPWRPRMKLYGQKAVSLIPPDLSRMQFHSLPSESTESVP